MKLQLPADVLAQWDAQWATPMKEAKKKDVAKACGRVKALFAECIAGRPASIDNMTVQNSLVPFPENDPVTRFLRMFFDAVVAHTTALGAGSLASAVQISTAKTKLGQVIEAWPQSANNQLHELCGLADPEVRKWTTNALAKIATYHARAVSGGHKELDALVAKAAKLVDRVPPGDEGKFREKMRKESAAIAAAQCQIAELLARMKRSDPNVDEEHPASVAEADKGLGKALRASFAAGTRMDAICYYYTCLYVGLTLFHGPTIRHDSDQGKAEQEKLKGVLQAMHGVKHKPCILPDSVSAMCAFINMPGLAAGTPSEPDTQAHVSNNGDGAPSTAVTVQPPPKRRRR